MDNIGYKAKSNQNKVLKQIKLILKKFESTGKMFRFITCTNRQKVMIA